MTARGIGLAGAELGRLIGLRVDGSTQGRLDRVVRREAESAGCSVDEYAIRLRHDPALLQRLVDRMTVQETSFFRHRAQLEQLPALLAGRPAGVIWSAGCANGQEAWSVAMLLVEHAAAGWSVLATDVSEAALARACAGRYAERELRGLDDVRRARFLRPVAGGGFEVAPALRERVRFAAHNVVDDPPPAQADGGVVLLRNVLIYLRPADVDAVLSRLRRWMPADGVLLLGETESLPADNPSFVVDGLDGAFAYRPRAERAMRPQARERRPPRPGPPRPALPEPLVLRAQAERAAAAGRLDEAVVLFRKALYLRPQDVLARVGLALALEAAGESGTAVRTALRAARAALDALDGEASAEELAGWPVPVVRALIDARLPQDEAVR